MGRGWERGERKRGRRKSGEAAEAKPAAGSLQGRTVRSSLWFASRMLYLAQSRRPFSSGRCNFGRRTPPPLSNPLSSFAVAAAAMRDAFIRSPAFVPLFTLASSLSLFAFILYRFQIHDEMKQCEFTFFHFSQTRGRPSLLLLPYRRVKRGSSKRANNSVANWACYCSCCLRNQANYLVLLLFSLILHSTVHTLSLSSPNSCSEYGASELRDA